jgi:PadR family transcriptional regulator PadR
MRSIPPDKTCTLPTVPLRLARGEDNRRNILSENDVYIVGLIGGIMGNSSAIGEFEQLVVLAVLRLGDEAFGVAIRREIEEQTGRPVSRGAVYTTLDRLESKGLLSSTVSDELSPGTGQARRYYSVEPEGIESLHAARIALRSMWDGLEPVGHTGAAPYRGIPAEGGTPPVGAPDSDRGTQGGVLGIGTAPQGAVQSGYVVPGRVYLPALVVHQGPDGQGAVT